MAKESQLCDVENTLAIEPEARIREALENSAQIVQMIFSGGCTHGHIVNGK